MSTLAFQQHAGCREVEHIRDAVLKTGKDKNYDAEKNHQHAENGGERFTAKTVYGDKHQKTAKKRKN